MDDYSTPEAVLALASGDKECDKYLKENPPPPFPYDDPVTIRKMVVAQTDAMELRRPGQSLSIPMRDGYISEALVFIPPELPIGTRSPLCVLVFGGAFMVGNSRVMAPHALDIADLFHATTVTISYRLAPENSFPAGQHDVMDSVSWLAQHAESFGADPAAGFIIGGISSGANLSATVAQMSLQGGLPAPLTGLWLCVPLLLNEDIVPDEYKDVFLSREQNKNSAGTGTEAITTVCHLYGIDWKSAEATPFSAERPHVGMPPTFVQVAGQDPMRDDGLIYERVLKANGVKTRLDVYPGVPHGHMGLTTLRSTRKWNVDLMKGIGWLLGQTRSRDELAEALGITDF